MARDDFDSPRDPERKHGSRSGPDSGRREARPGSGAPRRGRSGYGVESIRPHLRAQLEYQKLMRPTFPPQDPEDDKSNESD